MPFLAPNVYKQAADEPLNDLPIGPAPAAPCRKIIHIINLFAAPPGSEWDKVQKLTLASMEAAKRTAEETGGPTITFVAVTEPQDAACVPSGFETAPPLARSAKDIAAFEKPRPLPLLFDILDNGLAGRMEGPDAQATYVAFTNADICLQPDFYLTLAGLIDKGYDSFSIYRRTVPKFDLEASDLTAAAAHRGEDHGGHDCFVFPLETYRSFVKPPIIVGIPFLERPMLYNMATFGRGFALLPLAHMTFHFGDDREWDAGEFKDYLEFNRQACAKTLAGLCEALPDRRALGAFLHHNNDPFRLVHTPSGRCKPLDVKRKLNRLMYRTVLRPLHIR